MEHVPMFRYRCTCVSFWISAHAETERGFTVFCSSNPCNFIDVCLLHFNSVIDLQLKEIGGRSKPSDSLKSTEQPAEKKKGLVDWMNLMKPGSEEKDHWVMLKFFLSHLLRCSRPNCLVYYGYYQMLKLLISICVFCSFFVVTVQCFKRNGCVSWW